MKDVSEMGYVCIANPISSERRVMRRSLLVSALETTQSNLRNRERVAIFEIGSVYLMNGSELPDEQARLAIVMTGRAEPVTWLHPEPRSLDFFDLKGVIEEMLRHLNLSDQVSYEAGDHPSFQPGRVATLHINGTPIGTFGELHPIVRQSNDLGEGRVVAADLNLDRLISLVPERVVVQPVPRYPAVIQDVAVIVDEGTTASEVEAVIQRADGEVLAHVELFDVYRGPAIGEGKKSLAYTLRYLDPTRTLTDEEVASYHAMITSALRSQLGAAIRGEDG
jgi:phenylalanyl-tRNA synthetase beta chain